MAVELLKKSERIRKDVRLGKQRHESKYLAIEDFNTNKGGALAGCVISSALRGLHFINGNIE